VEARDLKLLNFDETNDFKYSKAIQVLLYAYLYAQNNSLEPDTSLEAGIISFKNLKSGVLKMNFSSNYKNPEHGITKEKLEQFIAQIKILLQEIYNPKVSFLEPSSLPF
jgi:ATP-dependent helicase/nuclease subunit B